MVNWFEPFTTAVRRNFQVQVRMLGVAAIVYQLLRRFHRPANLH